MNNINEGNITNLERTQRQISNIIKTYAPKAEVDKCVISKTSKGNWRVETPDGKKLCIISKFILSDEMSKELGNVKSISLK